MKRQRRTSRGMRPVYRDVHPDRCPLEVYERDGSIAIRADLDARIVTSIDYLAERDKVSVQKLARRALKQILGQRHDRSE